MRQSYAPSNSSAFRAVVKVPGTSANCGPGFDCLGLATTIYNYLDLTLLRANKIVVESRGVGSENIPRGRRNLAWQAVRRLLQEVGREDEFKGAIIRMKNNVPISRGLGSSSTAIVAGLTAANEILGSPFDRHRLLKLATELEDHVEIVVITHAVKHKNILEAQAALRALSVIDEIFNVIRVE